MEDSWRQSGSHRLQGLEWGAGLSGESCHRADLALARLAAHWPPSVLSLTLLPFPGLGFPAPMLRCQCSKAPSPFLSLGEMTKCPLLCPCHTRLKPLPPTLAACPLPSASSDAILVMGVAPTLRQVPPTGSSPGIPGSWQGRSWLASSASQVGLALRCHFLLRDPGPILQAPIFNP